MRSLFPKPHRALFWCVICLGTAGAVAPLTSQDNPALRAPSSATGPRAAQHKTQEPSPAQEPGSSTEILQKQQQDLLKSNFERMKRDADELSSLARSLREDLDKSNQNVLSLKIINKAERIEKLARKIRQTARGN